MENQPDTQEVVKSEQSEWKSRDKESILLYQKIVCSLGIFVTIVECTNLFQINAIASNSISKGFAIVTLLLVILNLATFAWTFYMTKIVRNSAPVSDFADNNNSSDQSSSNSSDNWSTRIILFLNIILLIAFLCYFILFSFAKQDIYNTVLKSPKEVQNIKTSLEDKSKLIFFFSFANIFICLFAIFCAYALNGTPLGNRFQVYIFGVFIAYTCFSILNKIRSIEVLYEKAERTFETWPVYITWAVSICSLVLTIFLYIANAKRLRIAYLTIGTFLLICCAIQLPATSSLFRNYTTLDKYYSENCQIEMGQISNEQLESLGCPNKYMYQEEQRNCDKYSDPETCFQPFYSCDKAQTSIVWEDKLLPSSNPLETNVLACLNTQCCGLANYIYTHPILALAALSFCQLVLVFVITCFSYQLSAQEKGNEKLNQKIQLLFFGIFFLILIVGVFMIIFFNTHTPLKKRPIVEAQFSTEITNEHDAELEHYPNKDMCNLFIYILQKYISTNTKIFDPSSKLNPNTGFSEISDLDKFLILGNDGTDFCSQNSECAIPGYVVALSTSVNTKDQNRYFKLGQQLSKYQKYVKVIPDQSAKSLFASDALNNDQRNFFGLIGDKQIIQNLINTELKLCGYDTTKIDNNNNNNNNTNNNTNNNNTTKNNTANSTTDNTTNNTTNNNTNKTATNTTNTTKTLLLEQNAQGRKLSKSLSHNHINQHYQNTNPTNNNTTNNNTTNNNTTKNTTNNNVTKKAGPDDQKFFITVYKVDLIKYGFRKQDFKNVAKKQNNKLLSLEEDSTRDSLLKQIVHSDQLSNFRVLSKKEHIKTQNNHLQELAAGGKGSFKVVVFGLEDDIPLANTKLTFYSIQTNEISNRICKPSTFLTPTPRQPEFEAITGSDGLVELEVLFKDETTEINYMIFAEHDNYHSNCRYLNIKKSNFQNYLTYPFDIGLGKQLNSGQVRAVLEWDSLKLRDIDLFAQFGQYNKTYTFNCQVGYFSPYCGKVIYHGDSEKKKWGNSTEAITFLEIKKTDYLVYINTFVKDIFKIISQNSSDYAQRLFDSQPIVKYYAAEGLYPEKTILSSDYLKASTPNPNNYTLLSKSVKLDILQFCILADQEVNSMRARVFTNPKQAIWYYFKVDSYGYDKLYYNAQFNDLPSTEDTVFTNQNQKLCRSLTSVQNDS